VNKPWGRQDTESDQAPPGDDTGGDGSDGDEPWWDGRRVAIRPDVPGRKLDPEALVLIKTDRERIDAQAKIEKSIDETKKKSLKDLWPRWLWKVDDDLAPELPLTDEDEDTNLDTKSA
jgi:hypothetical protein